VIRKAISDFEFRISDWCKHPLVILAKAGIQWQAQETWQIINDRIRGGEKTTLATIRNSKSEIRNPLP
jgi:hypothetical protein